MYRVMSCDDRGKLGELVGQALLDQSGFAYVGHSASDSLLSIAAATGPDIIVLDMLTEGAPVREAMASVLNHLHATRFVTVVDHRDGEAPPGIAARVHRSELSAASLLDAIRQSVPAMR